MDKLVEDYNGLKLWASENLLTGQQERMRPDSYSKFIFVDCNVSPGLIECFS